MSVLLEIPQLAAEVSARCAENWLGARTATVASGPVSPTPTSQTVTTATGIPRSATRALRSSGSLVSN